MKAVGTSEAVSVVITTCVLASSEAGTGNKAYENVRSAADGLTELTSLGRRANITAKRALSTTAPMLGAEERRHGNTRSKGYKKYEDPLAEFEANAWKGGLKRARDFRQRMADIGEYSLSTASLERRSRPMRVFKTGAARRPL